VPFLVTTAELDPPGIIAFAEALNDQRCIAGHCPEYLVFKDHSAVARDRGYDVRPLTGLNL
jgi:hypothetical protein